MDGRQLMYTDVAPRAGWLRLAEDRSDDQIMLWELLAVALGLWTFLPRLRGRVCRVWTDNAGGEGALRKGAAAAVDHNRIVHAAWLLAAQEGFGLRIERVDTHSNISDLPSREEYQLLSRLGAAWWDPQLPSELGHPDTWGRLAALGWE